MKKSTLSSAVFKRELYSGCMFTMGKKTLTYLGCVEYVQEVPGGTLEHLEVYVVRDFSGKLLALDCRKAGKKEIIIL